MFDYKELLGHSLFDSKKDCLEYPDPNGIRLAYQRARLVCQQSGELPLNPKKQHTAAYYLYT